MIYGYLKVIAPPTIYLFLGEKSVNYLLNRNVYLHKKEKRYTFALYRTKEGETHRKNCKKLC